MLRSFWIGAAVAGPAPLAGLVALDGYFNVVVGENARHDVYEPTLAWIQKHLQAR